MLNSINILLVGVGGQGTILATRVLAKAAQDTGYDIKVSEIKGMAQRGGSVVSQVRYGDKVYSPIIKKGDADIILAFEKVEAARWLDYLKKDGMVIINDERVDPLPVMTGKFKYPEDITEKIKNQVKRTIVVNASEIAQECGSIRVANVVLVGMLSAALGLSGEDVEKSVARTVPAKALKMNISAFRKGCELLNKAV
jgi:indolepyruvate ferredoxin oxidoreductase beta subunit